MWVSIRFKVLLLSAAGVSAHAHKNWGTDYEGHAIFVRSVSLVLMVLSIFMAVYAAWNFHYRGEMLQCTLLPLAVFQMFFVYSSNAQMLGRAGCRLLAGHDTVIYQSSACKSL